MKSSIINIVSVITVIVTLIGMLAFPVELGVDFDGSNKEQK